jgi:hypothetical protein
VSGDSAQIAARLDRIPASRTLWTIVVLISLGGAFEFYDLFFTAYVAPGMLKRPFHRGLPRSIRRAEGAEGGGLRYLRLL